MKGQLILQDSPIFPGSQKRSRFPHVSLATQSSKRRVWKENPYILVTAKVQKSEIPWRKRPLSETLCVTDVAKLLNSINM